MRSAELLCESLSTCKIPFRGITHTSFCSDKLGSKQCNSGNLPVRENFRPASSKFPMGEVIILVLLANLWELETHKAPFPSVGLISFLMASVRSLTCSQEITLTTIQLSVLYWKLADPLSPYLLTETDVKSVTCSQESTSSVRICSSGTALLSFLRNISRTMDSRFHMPSGSRPRNGRSKLCHSAAAGGAVDDK